MVVGGGWPFPVLVRLYYFPPTQVGAFVGHELGYVDYNFGSKISFSSMCDPRHRSWCIPNTSPLISILIDNFDIARI